MSLYSRVLQELLLPSYDFVRGSRHSHYRALVEKSQWWSQDRILDFQWQELRKLLRYAFDSVPFYQEKYRAAGACFDDIRSWDDFARLPTLSREEITRHATGSEFQKRSAEADCSCHRRQFRRAAAFLYHSAEF